MTRRILPVLIAVLPGACAAPDAGPPPGVSGTILERGDLENGGLARQGQDMPSVAALSGVPRVILGNWMTVESAFDAVGRAAGYPLLVHWADLERIDLQRTEQLRTTTPSVTIDAALFLIHESQARRDEKAGWDYSGALDYRIEDGIMEIATRRFFDRREHELVFYDVAGAVRAQRWPMRTQQYGQDSGDRAIGYVLVPTREECLQAVADIIQECVEPEGWVNNGGDAAALRCFADRLLIGAPRRYHAKIRALLGRLPGDPPYRIVPVPPDLPEQADPP